MKLPKSNAKQIADSFRKHMLKESNVVLITETIYPEGDTYTYINEIDYSDDEVEQVYSEVLDDNLKVEDIKSEFEKLGVECRYKKEILD